MFERKKSGRHKNRITCRKTPIIVILETFYKFIPVIVGAFFLTFFTEIVFFKNYNLLIYRIICVTFALEALRNYYNNLYLIGRRRLITLTGVLGLHYKRSSINYGDVREVKIKQSIFGRVLNYGTLKIGTASTKTHEIVFKDVHNARALRRYIENTIHERRKGLKSVHVKAEQWPKIEKTSVTQN